MGLWFKRDCHLTSDPRVELLGGEFGAEGVLAFEELIAVAKLAGAQGDARMGWAQLRKRALVRRASTARAIVAALADLDLIQIVAADDASVTYTVAGWGRWNDTSAERQARRRAKAKAA